MDESSDDLIKGVISMTLSHTIYLLLTRYSCQKSDLR